MQKIQQEKDVNNCFNDLGLDYGGITGPEQWWESKVVRTPTMTLNLSYMESKQCAAVV